MCQSLFLIKLQASGVNVFLWILQNFTERCFYRIERLLVSTPSQFLMGFMETLKTSIFIFKTLSINSVTEWFSETLFVTWKVLWSVMEIWVGEGSQVMALCNAGKHFTWRISVLYCVRITVENKILLPWPSSWIIHRIVNY